MSAERDGNVKENKKVGFHLNLTGERWSSPKEVARRRSREIDGVVTYGVVGGLGLCYTWEEGEESDRSERNGGAHGAAPSAGMSSALAKTGTGDLWLSLPFIAYPRIDETR